MTPPELSLTRNRAAKAYRLACEAHRLGLRPEDIDALDRIAGVASPETAAMIAGVLDAMASVRDPFCDLPQPHVCIRNDGQPIRAGMDCYVRTSAELRRQVVAR